MNRVTDRVLINESFIVDNKCSDNNINKFYDRIDRIYNCIFRDLK